MKLCHLNHMEQYNWENNEGTIICCRTEYAQPWHHNLMMFGHTATLLVSNYTAVSSSVAVKELLYQTKLTQETLAYIYCNIIS